VLDVVLELEAIERLVVEQFDQHEAGPGIGDCREAADIGVPQNRADALDRTALDRALMNAPAGVAAEAGGRDIAALAAERDQFLVDLLALKASPTLRSRAGGDD